MKIPAFKTEKITVTLTLDEVDEILLACDQKLDEFVADKGDEMDGIKCLKRAMQKLDEAVNG